jgi:hypothetical protein
MQEIVHADGAFIQFAWTAYSHEHRTRYNMETLHTITGQYIINTSRIYIFTERATLATKTGSCRLLQSV